MFNVIRDTREQRPWGLVHTSVAEIIEHKLDTGDYSIQGLEDKLCIERKKSVSELAGNIIDKRFKNELERMAKFKYKFLILEFDCSHIEIYPAGTNIPQKVRDKIRVTGPFIMKMLAEIQVLGIHVVFCSNARYAETVAINIMRRVHELETSDGN